MRILIVDDDRAILKLIERVLRDEAYAVDLAASGEEARTLALVNDYDGIILDLQLGDRHGFEILQELRRNGRRTPVLLYSGLSDTDTIVRGLDAGADDYVVKPFSPNELMARVRALLRRTAPPEPSEQVLRCGPIRLDAARHTVSNDGEDVRLTAKEFLLLQYLMEHRGRVLSRDRLLSDVWDYRYPGATRTVDVHVRRLREKLPFLEQALVTVQQFGYKLLEP
jgi:DNA-binding response OmpR family regulator